MKKQPKIKEQTKKIESGPLNCKCSHSEQMHYGTEKKHCNTTGCACLELTRED